MTKQRGSGNVGGMLLVLFGLVIFNVISVSVAMVIFVLYLIFVD